MRGARGESRDSEIGPGIRSRRVAADSGGTSLRIFRPASWLVLTLAVLVCLLGAVLPAFASGDGHGDTAKLKHTVDLEGKTGFSLFIARLYNNNRLLYALVVTAIMALMGIVVAKFTGLVLRLIGVE